MMAFKRHLSRGRAIAVGMLLLALLWALCMALHQPGPVYQGKPLAFWLKGFDNGYVGVKKPSREESVAAVHGVGTNAIPILLRMLRARNSDLKHTLIRFFRKSRFIKIDYVTADRERWAAREGFLALGLYARSAIPQLAEISRVERSRAEWNKYATEILDLLQQTWPNEVGDEIAGARKRVEQE